MTLLHTGPDVAQDAGLRYVSDQTPGWTRKPHGRGFTYLDAHGNRLPDPDAQRVRDLVIPPAWQDVWVCPDPDGHLQVTGRDQQGRKVYRYHDRWNDHRNRCKFDALVRFAHALPTIREHIARDLDQPCASRRRVLATVVQLLQSTHIRIGNDQYAKANGSYGLTTLRRKHVRIDGQHIRFEFTGKSGKQHQIDLEDAQLARSLEACSDLPGYELFKYIDEAGDKQRIDSGEVNGYLHEITG
jgi:DNA topoisomerase-1